MADHNNPHSSQRRYPPELRERAVRMVFATIEQTGERFGAITRGARQLGIGSESLRSWCAKPRSTAASGPGDHHRAAAHRRAGAGGPGAPPHRRDPQVGVGFLRGRAGRPSPAMTRYIEVHRDRFGPGPICRVLQVAPVHLLRPAEPPPSARVSATSSSRSRSGGSGTPTTGCMGREDLAAARTGRDPGRPRPGGPAGAPTGHPWGRAGWQAAHHHPGRGRRSSCRPGQSEVHRAGA
jgi:transposase-like protein